jgi:hypothetical protein
MDIGQTIIGTMVTMKENFFATSYNQLFPITAKNELAHLLCIMEKRDNRTILNVALRPRINNANNKQV